jgi:hypothetical protein
MIFPPPRRFPAGADYPHRSACRDVIRKVADGSLDAVADIVSVDTGFDSVADVRRVDPVDLADAVS